MSDSVQPHRRQPTRLPRPWDSPGKNTGVGCHLLLQCMKVKSESEVAQSCPTLVTPWTAAHQAPPPVGFSRQKYWSGVPSPSLLRGCTVLSSTVHRQLLCFEAVNTLPQGPCGFHSRCLENSRIILFSVGSLRTKGGLDAWASHRYLRTGIVRGNIQP